MRKRSLRTLISLSFMTLLTGTLFLSPAAALHTEAAVKSVRICLDPGHGGDGDNNHGVEREYDGKMVMEKEITLKLAEFLKEELVNYQGVKVSMTRKSDRKLSISSRISTAKKQNADYLISLHINSANDSADADKVKGCMVLLPASRYQPKGTKSKSIYDDCTRIGSAVVANLTNLGLTLSSDLDADKTGGLVRRPYTIEAGATKNVKYPDGSYSDYYGLLRQGVEAGIPTLIIEHAYLSNESDYRSYLSDDAALRTLAHADAQALVDALELKKRK
ncbi:MAG: N-acetylmuramoyl-L-alanine amidase [Lachnospiraceae bacterium]|nr:N-acetylmuramoyl-L-alanine amidase [Lachnospiraceae bacterium]